MKISDSKLEPWSSYLDKVDTFHVIFARNIEYLSRITTIILKLEF